jgi:ubiquinone/menaquinone biosynthesis C-methylase UbiE
VRLCYLASVASDDRLRRYWDKQAVGFDRQMGTFDRYFAADTRAWICGRATGQVLEVAVGTGLNLSHYPSEVRLTGIEWSDAMLAEAQRKARSLGLTAELRQGDAQTLPYEDESFDTVVCTFSLCAIPDDRRAVDEMVRVLRPGGLLLLADHVESANWAVRGLQRLAEVVTVRVGGEYFRRRPIRHVEALGLSVEDHDRFKFGIIERLAARKGTSDNDNSPVVVSG